MRYTLLADGSSDRALLRIIDWLLGAIPSISHRGILPQFADLRQLSDRPFTLADRIGQAVIHFPCDILFVHRDAEREPMKNRLHEIEQAAIQAEIPDRVPVVPVRMTEAWLLLEVDAIRRAADNPNGTARIVLPRLKELESEPNPKHLLEELLIAASEKTGRRLGQFRSSLSWRRNRVATFIRDFSSLHELTAFSYFAAETKRAVEAWHKAHQC